MDRSSAAVIGAEHAAPEVQTEADARYDLARRLIPRALFDDKALRAWLAKGGDPYDSKKIAQLVEGVKILRSRSAYNLTKEEKHRLLADPDNVISQLLAAFVGGEGNRPVIDATLLAQIKDRFPGDPLAQYAWLMQDGRYIKHEREVGILRSLLPNSAIPDLMQGLQELSSGNIQQGLEHLRLASHLPLSDQLFGRVQAAELQMLMDFKGLTLRQALLSETRVEALGLGKLFSDIEYALQSIPKDNLDLTGTPWKDVNAYRLAVLELKAQSHSVLERSSALSAQTNMMETLVAAGQSPHFVNSNNARIEIKAEAAEAKGIAWQFMQFPVDGSDEDLQTYWKNIQEKDELNAFLEVIKSNPASSTK